MVGTFCAICMVTDCLFFFHIGFFLVENTHIENKMFFFVLVWSLNVIIFRLTFQSHFAKECKITLIDNPNVFGVMSLDSKANVVIQT